MRMTAKEYVTLAAAVLVMAAFVSPAVADVELSNVSWRTVGTTVTFHLQFHNPDFTNPSGEVSGELNTQPFGAFVADNGQIGTFNVPPLAPDSFFDIWYDVDLSTLPPNPEVITPGGASSSSGLSRSTAISCATNGHGNTWSGNVDVLWSGAGGSGAVNYHFGTIPVATGAGPSYIHVVTDCSDPAGMSWSFTPLCTGWTATLLLDDGTLNPDGPAPNPVPSGPFDGWISVSADSTVSPGDSCCFDVNFMCGSQPATIHVCAEACSDSPVSTEESTWGRIKTIYKKDD